VQAAIAPSCQHLVHRHQIELRVRGQEALHDGVVFFIQQAAGRVDQAAAEFHQARGTVQDRSLFLGHLGDAVDLLAPLHIRIAAQRAHARARRIDQHAVDLAGQALDLGVAFVRDHHRMHVRQAAARHARLQLGQALFRHVEGVQAAGIAHDGADGQRLAAGAGAEVDHHLAAARAQQLGQHLAALVLDFDRAFLEQRQVLQRRFLHDAQAGRGVRGRLGDDRRGGQLGDDLLAVGLQGVDAQVQRRRRVQHGGQLQGLFLAVLGDELVVQPVRQVGALLRRQQRTVDFLDAGQEGGFVFAQAAQRFGADGVGHAQQDQAAHGRAGAGAETAEVGVEALVAQYRVDALGNGAALAAAQAGMVLEVARQGDVGGRGEAQDLAQYFFSIAEDRGWQSHVFP
jgi:hypothetical protein